MREHIKNYQKKLFNTLEDKNLYSQIEKLYNEILIAWRNKKIFSFAEMAVGGNAIHIANDFIYGAGITNNSGLKIEALTSNQSVITCLANDLGYENIFLRTVKSKSN